MAKRKRIFTATTLKKRLLEKRGQGTGINYKPWIRIHDISSRGLSHRVMSVWTTHRETHLLSNLERDWFQTFDWATDIIDIREQFPLLNLEETIAIAAECGIKHPAEPKTGHHIVMTSDFVLTYQTALGPVHKACTAKPENELSKERVLEKFEIERRYWERRGIEWSILTKKDLSSDLVYNIELIRKKFDISDRLTLTHELLYQIAQMLTDKTHILPLQEAASECEKFFNLTDGAGLTVAYYLLANRYWEIDMYQKINPGYKLNILRQSIEKLNPKEEQNHACC